MLTKLLTDGLHEVMSKHGVPHSIAQAGSMFCTFFTPGPVSDLEERDEVGRGCSYAKYFHAMLDRGIYLAPSQFEAGFVSTRPHDAATSSATLAAADAALARRSSAAAV